MLIQCRASSQCSVSMSSPSRGPWAGSFGVLTAIWSPTPRWSSIGILTSVDKVLGNFSELDVEVLGGSTQHVERLARGDPLSFHKNPQGLPDGLATSQSGVKVVGSAFLVLMGLGNRESKAGQRRQNSRFGSIDDAEGGRVASVEI